MWELLSKVSHGRISLRRFSLLVTALLMTFFVATATLTLPAYADDAVRAGDTVQYEGKTLQPLEDTQVPTGLPAGTSGFIFYDSTAKKTYYIFTSGDATTASSGQYVVYDNNVNPPSKTTPVTVTITGSLAADTGDESGEDVDNNGSNNCDGASMGAVGWIICPTVTFLAKGMDFIYKILLQFLEVKTITGNTNSSIYQLWAIVRDVANICFVIVFLIIVYSQITGIGISNHGIKRMIPRLILAAILVNVSYWICALCVDISNLLGYSIHTVFYGVMERLNVGASYQQTIPNWEQIAAVALSGGAVTTAGYFILAGTVTGSVYMLVPFLVGVIIAALVALIILAARQALITCLIIISPLAFVAYTLPNTEKYFDKWRGVFMTMLLMFPIFSLIFSGAQLAGMAIIQNAGGNLITIILGLAVQVAPVVITPLLIKFSGSLLGKVAGMVNNPSKGLMDRTRNWATGKSQERKNKILADQNRFKGLNNSWLNPAGKATRAIDTRRRKIEARRKAYEMGAENRYDNTETGQRMKALGRDMESGKQEAANRFERSSYGIQSNFRSQMATIDKDRAHNEFEAHHLGHQVDTEKREVERQKQTIHAEHEQNWHFRNLTDAGSQEREMKLRMATDKTAFDKLQVDTAYNELKLGESKAIAAIAANGADGKALATKLAEDAYALAEMNTLTTMRNNNATSELRDKINQAVLNNGAVYELDSKGEKVLGTDGKPIVVSTRTIDGKSIRDYATGFGKAEITLANAVAEDRSEWNKQAQAAGELIAHFKLDSANVQTLATKGGPGATISVKDDNGNEFEFDANDEYIKEAAIDKLFKEGSYGQKMAMLKETGAEIREVDPVTGKVTVRRGYNYAHRSTVKSDAVSSGIAALAPFINDITYNEIQKGNFNGDDSINMHAMRQIAEGRIKVDNLAGANDGALRILANIGKLRKSSDPTDVAEFNRYKTMLFDFFGDMYGKGTPAYDAAVDNFETSFDSNFDQTLKSFKQIVENSNLSRSTSVASRNVITQTLGDNGVTFREP